MSIPSEGQEEAEVLSGRRKKGVKIGVKEQSKEICRSPQVMLERSRQERKVDSTIAKQSKKRKRNTQEVKTAPAKQKSQRQIKRNIKGRTKTGDETKKTETVKLVGEDISAVRRGIPLGTDSGQVPSTAEEKQRMPKNKSKKKKKRVKLEELRKLHYQTILAEKEVLQGLDLVTGKEEKEKEEKYKRKTKRKSRKKTKDVGSESVMVESDAGIKSRVPPLDTSQTPNIEEACPIQTQRPALDLPATSISFLWAEVRPCKYVQSHRSVVDKTFPLRNDKICWRHLLSSQPRITRSQSLKEGTPTVFYSKFVT